MSKAKPKILKFNPKINKITGRDFSYFHVGGMQFPSDMFYARFANEIYPIINDVFKNHNALTPEISKRTALNLACYLEDLVAGNGIWAAFTSLHEKKYGLKLPFYNEDKLLKQVPYSDDIPSLQAVQFLLWYSINGTDPNAVFNPCNPAIAMLAMDLTSKLIEAFEKAPETPARPAIMPESELGIPVFYQIRNLCLWLCERCYLTRVHDLETLTEDFADFLEQTFRGFDDSQSRINYGISSFVPFNALIGPLGITPQEWLAEIVELYHEEEEEEYIPMLRQLRSLPYSFYSYKKVSGDNAVIVSKDGEEMSLSAMTMPGEKFAPGIKKGCCSMMSLVYFDGSWVMNSLCLQPLPDKLFKEVQEEHKRMSKQRADSYTGIMKVLKNKRIGVCKNYDEYMSFFNKADDCKSNISAKDYNALNDVDNLLYFVNDNSDVSLLPNFGDCVKIRGNKYYSKEAANDKAICLIFDHSISSPDFRRYIIENNLIPDAALSSVISTKAGCQLFQRNMRFLNDYTNRNTLPFLQER